MIHLNATDVLRLLNEYNSKRVYQAMYSSFYGGYVTNPELMLVPIDDHLVHRGDGVFEAIRVTKKGAYLLEAHLERLYRSAAAISLEVPYKLNHLEKICKELLEVTKSTQNAAIEEKMLRVFVSRGPGDFSPNPYTTLGSQVYVVVMSFKPMVQEVYDKGARVMVSKVPVKHAPYATVKSCNYLPNVMMKKEAVDAKCDFSVGLTDEGFVAEGPTENIMMISHDGYLLAPDFDYTLRGTTLVRAMELSKRLIQSEGLKGARVQNIHISDFERAREIMMVGTTLSVLPVTEFNGRRVATGIVGPIAKELKKIVDQDMGN